MAEKLTKELRAKKREERKEWLAEKWESYKAPVCAALGAIGGSALTLGAGAVVKTVKKKKAEKASIPAEVTPITPPEELEAPSWGYTPEEQARIDACANLDFPNTETPTVETF